MSTDRISKSQSRLNEARWQAPWTTAQGKHKKGFWYIRHEGRKVSLTKHGAPRKNTVKDDEKKARRARDKWLESLRNGMAKIQVARVTSVFTVRNAVELYTADVVPQRSVAYQKRVGLLFRSFCDGHTGEQPKRGCGKVRVYAGWGDRAVSDITNCDMLTWVSRHDCPKTGGGHMIAPINTAFNYAMKMRKVESNPIADFAVHQDAAPDIQWFETDAEEGAFRTAAHESSPSFAEFWEALLATGARPLELATAQRKHLRRANGRYVIELSEWKNSRKTKRKRVIHLPASWQEWAAGKAADTQGDEYLFVTDSGNPWTRNNWGRVHRIARGESGLWKPLTLYSARHTRITRLLLSGATAHQVAKLMGTGTQQIDRTYSHILDAVSEMGDILDRFSN